MQPKIIDRRWKYLAIGSLVGFLLSAFMPAQPLHAVATQGQDGFVLATGLLDSNVEGVYFLDGLTGVLKGCALNVNNGKFTTTFEANVVNDMKLDSSKDPKFLMVTGLAGLRHGPTQFQPGLAVLYIVEVNTGTLACYGVRWNIGQSTQPSPALRQAGFELLDKFPLRNIAVRPQ